MNESILNEDKPISIVNEIYDDDIVSYNTDIPGILYVIKYGAIDIKDEAKKEFHYTGNYKEWDCSFYEIEEQEFVDYYIADNLDEFAATQIKKGNYTIEDHR